MRFAEIYSIIATVTVILTYCFVFVSNKMNVVLCTIKLMLGKT